MGSHFSASYPGDREQATATVDRDKAAMTSRSSKEIMQAFRPRARMLQLLGDELIASDRLAVFELVKNAYDADSTAVRIRLDHDRSGNPRIVVRDDGEGMTLDTIRSVWLVPGNEHRKKQRESGIRTPKHGRLPLGEKGLGRFAVHKLGNHIRLVTRARDSEECVVVIDWNELINQPFLDEAPVRIIVRRPRVFTGNSTGTRIRVGQLRSGDWQRGEVRRLHNQVTSICSPFEEPGEFSAKLSVPSHENWISDLPDVSNILEHAIWKFSFELDGGTFNWEYNFRRIPGLNLQERALSERSGTLQLPARAADSTKRRRKVVADGSTTKGIGRIRGEMYVYDRDREIVRKMAHTQLLSNYLDENGGVRVYRDGIRVYNYGEQGDDWLGLDLRRVNSPTRGISSNIILGAVHLSLAESSQLVEKTNREGFVENEALDRIRDVVIGALSVLETERQKDKARIRQLTGVPGEVAQSTFERHIAQLRLALGREGLERKVGVHVNRLEREYLSMQRTLLSAGMSGLNLAVIFHEVDRGVRALHRLIVEENDPASSARHAEELVRTLEGFSALLRGGGRRDRSARELLSHIRDLNYPRLRYHDIGFTCPPLDDSGEGFRSRVEFRLVLGALNNVIDNALYWLRVRWPDTDSDRSSSGRRLYVGITRDLPSGPAIVVADNGTGFRDDPENMVHPFFTRKPNGMGIGLYYAKLAMELNGGELAFPNPNEVGVPAEYDGGVVALIFKEAK